MTTTSSRLPRGKDQAHFRALDGMRGVAACMVVLYHLGHWLAVPYLVANGNLAVDFFFCLSGFVLVNAYGSQSGRPLAFAGFVRLRLIRLMPAVWLATGLSALYVALRCLLKAHQQVGGSLPLASLLGLLSLPYFDAPVSIGGPQVFPLNGPQYTLFLELVVNVAWFAVRGAAGLKVSLLVSAASICLLPIAGLGGDSTHDFLSGLPRVAGSFFLGVSIFYLRGRGDQYQRLHSTAFVATSAIFIGLCLYPAPLPLSVGIIAIFIFPVAVLSGSLCRTPAGLTSATAWLGDISYPVYALHYPVFCWMNGLTQSLLPGRWVVIEVPACFIASLLASWCALRAFDVPVRRHLAALNLQAIAVLTRRDA